MNDILNTASQHLEAIAFVGWYLFSAAMSQMPPLPESAGYFTRWAHDFFQFLAANPAKFSTRKVPAQPGKEA